MSRFYIPPALWDPAQLRLTGPEAHHCADVMRMKPGQSAVVFNGEGASARVRIEQARRDAVELVCEELLETAARACRITLGQAIPKGKNMELIIEKATELGAAAIVPLLSTRTVVQIEGADRARKQEKWQRVALEAAKQCGQNWLPSVELPCTPKAFFDSAAPFDLMLFGSLENDARSLKSVLAAHAKARGAIASALVLIGPEGDFTPQEYALARERGCEPITFGPSVLRAETAALYALSVLGYELREG